MEEDAAKNPVVPVLGAGTDEYELMTWPEIAAAARQQTRR